jgi:hypothetical protein
VSDEANAKLWDCIASTDWNMFWDYSNGIEEYTTSVIGFINKCIDDVITTVTVRTYPNLPDELNYCNAHFEANNTEKCMRAPAVPEDCVITLS